MRGNPACSLRDSIQGGRGTTVTWYARGEVFNVSVDKETVSFTAVVSTRPWRFETIVVDVEWLPGCVRRAVRDVWAALNFKDTAADKIRKARWAKREAAWARRTAEWDEQKAKWEAQDAAWYARHPGKAIDGSDPNKAPR